MPTFSEALEQMKSTQQPEQATSPVKPSGEFAARLERLKAEEAAQAAMREQLVAETPSLVGRVSEAITGRERETEATRTLPEFRETEEIQAFAPRGIGSQLKLTAGLLSSFSPQAQIDVIKENIPEARFEQDEKGNIIVDIEGKRSILNKPGFSGQDAVQALTNILSFIPAAKLTNLGTSTLARLGLGGSGAAATEQATQEISRLAGSEQERRPMETALAGAIGAGAELVGPARQALRERRLARQLERAGEGITDVTENIMTARKASEGVKEFTGVDVPLYKPQQTLIPSELKMQRLLPQLDASSQKAMKELNRQNKSVADAVSKAIDKITPEEVVGAPEKFRTAAQKSVDARKAIRKERTSPLYNEAFKDTSPIDIVSVKDLLKEKISEAPKGSDLEKVMNKISGFLEGDQRLSKLQKTKLQIDDMISKFGEGSLGNSTKREVVEVKDALLDAMDTASPKYREARRAFAAESPAVTELEESIIGKVSKLDDIQVESLANKIFDPKLRTKTVRDAKRVIDSVDPSAWNDILKFKMLDNMSKIKPTASDGIENTASKIRRSLFGNEAQKRSLMAGMNPEQRRNFQYLDEVLDRASRGRGEGSPTASFTQILENVKSVPMMLRNLLTVNVGEIQKVGERGLLNRRLKAIANATFDEEWADQLKTIRKMNQNTPAAAKAMGQLLIDIDNALENIEETRKTE